MALTAPTECKHGRLVRGDHLRKNELYVLVVSEIQLVRAVLAISGAHNYNLDVGPGCDDCYLDSGSARHLPTLGGSASEMTLGLGNQRSTVT